MTDEMSIRESQRAAGLAAEYREKGYTVTTEPDSLNVPDFLKPTGYLPDLVATSDGENLIIEVKSRQTTRDLARLSEVSDLVNAQPGWKFVLVLTNPREAPPPWEGPNASKASELLAKARAIGHEDAAHTEAAFLFCWAALEAALRLALSPGRPTQMRTLLRDATIAGQLDRRDEENLERLWKVRSSLLHAGSEVPPTATDIATIERIVEELVRDVFAQGGAAEGL